MELKQKILNIIAENKKTAGTYFSPLGIWGQDKEVPNSGAIKALLNPSDEEYCIKGKYHTLFLEKFIDLLELDLGNIDYKNVRVSTEHSSKDDEGNSHGRVDIQIDVDEDTVIFIENKINAELDSEQLGKYYFPHKAKNKYMVYLSKEGDDPTPQSLKFKNKSLGKDDVICISYADIGEWLASCLAKITPDEQHMPLRLGVQMYLDNIYNIIGDGRSIHSIWAKVYKAILDFIQEEKEKITIEALEEIKLEKGEDEDNYIKPIIEIIKMRSFIMDSYKTISDKFPEDICLVYESNGGQYTRPINNLESDATELLIRSYDWVGLAVRIRNGQIPLYYGFYLNEATYMLISFVCRTEENPDTLIYKNIDKKHKVSYQTHEKDKDYYKMDSSNIGKFIEAIPKLRKDFSSIDTCGEYLTFRHNAAVFLNVMDYLKQQNVECSLTYTNEIDLSLMNNDWWLYFGGIFALGYGAGSMWLFVDSTSKEGKEFANNNEDKLEKLGFDHECNKFDSYGEDYWEFVFEDSDEIEQKDVKKFTKDITKKIDELLKLPK